MKTFTSIIMCSLVAALVGCGGGDTSSANDPLGDKAKPELPTKLADSKPSGVGIATSTDVPAGVTKGKK